MPFAQCLAAIILPEQSYLLFVLVPKGTDCILGSRERKRGLFVPRLNNHHTQNPL